MHAKLATPPKWLNTILFGAVLTVNALANLIPFGGNTTAQVSEKYPNLFTPAPVTFAIWAVIYLLLGAFIIWQWTGKTADKYVLNAGPWFALSCLFNIGWIFAWHYDVIWLSCVFIACLLASLTVLTLKVRSSSPSFFERLLGEVGFEIYLGWIIAATIANVSVLLTKLSWNGFGLSEQVWTVAVLLIGMIISVLVSVKGHMVFASLAVVWAYAGILNRHISQSFFDGKYPVIVITALLSVVVTASAALIGSYLAGRDNTDTVTENSAAEVTPAEAK